MALALRGEVEGGTDSRLPPAAHIAFPTGSCQSMGLAPGRQFLCLGLGAGAACCQQRVVPPHVWPRQAPGTSPAALGSCTRVPFLSGDREPVGRPQRAEREQQPPPGTAGCPRVRLGPAPRNTGPDRPWHACRGQRGAGFPPPPSPSVVVVVVVVTPRPIPGRGPCPSGPGGSVSACAGGRRPGCAHPFSFSRVCQCIVLQREVDNLKEQLGMRTLGRGGARLQVSGRAGGLGPGCGALQLRVASRGPKSP